MTNYISTAIAGLSLAIGVAAALPAAAQDLPSNLRIVIGSTSTGGDTYQNSSIIADALAAELGINIKVDAVGPAEGFKALGRDSSGSTMMIFHDHAYLGELYGVRGFDNIFEDYRVGPTVSINPGNAYAVPKNSPYQSMDDIFQAAADGTRVRVAIQPGGVSEIGFSAMKNAASVLNPGSEANIVAMNTGSQSDKDQLLFDGQADVINASIQSNEQYTQLPADDQKAMRFVWLTAREATIQGANPEGMGAMTRDDMLKYVSPTTSVTLDGSVDFTFDKEFFFIYNKDMDPALVEAIDTGLAAVFDKGDVQNTLKASFFIPNFLPSAEAQAHLSEKRATYEKVISAIGSE
ncbi:hypothetical protein [Puniceibacterium confluentis]|uniref:hypothetical protein n=1 Tax=Puniceibacterium confluentis TaxID=1958944 RepID=UPI00356AFF5A